jgi:uncharacterized membrane protein
MKMDAKNGQTDGGQLSPREVTIRRVFRWSLILKAIDSAIEMAAGVALYFVSHSAIMGFVRWLTRTELLEDPRDFIANWLMHSAEALSVSRKDAAAVYLLSHGAIKLFLVVMVLREKNWAYPVFMAALVLLIGYQCYQIAIAFSLWLSVLTVFDAVVLVLTWHEYRLHRRVKAMGG